VPTDYEPYVADPAEPPARRRLARLAPALWAILAMVLLVGVTTVYWNDRGTEDPALRAPSSQDG
jgi:peptidoglycan/LPS O-acetylase OafA/YrhL